MRSFFPFVLAYSSLALGSAYGQSFQATPAQPPQPNAPATLNLQAPAPTVVDAALDDAVPQPGAARADGSKGGGNPYFVGFIGGSYYPPEDERVDAKLQAEVQIAPTDGRPEPTSYAFVMFARRITPARLDELRSLGCRVLGVHPHYNVVVALPPQQIDTVAALPYVRWIGAPRAQQKVHPSLLDALDSHPANVPIELIVDVYESDVCEATVREEITRGEQLDVEGKLTSDVDADARNAAVRLHSNGWQQHTLADLGLEVVEYTESHSVRAFRVRALPAALESIVALDFVQFVEQMPTPAPSHDESMPLTYADSTRVYATGATSLSVVGGEIDSGISPGHSDLYYHLNGWGWDFSGSGTGAWYDACGHGTHVCGTITGDGTSDASARGVAPGLGWGATGRFQQSKIFASCSPQAVNLASVMGVMRAGSWDGGGAYTPRAHVINNSWGTGGYWTGSEYNSRLVDDEVFWQKQFYAFAAGNDANTSTIGQEGVAKNAFTVGSIDDYAAVWTQPAWRSSFSSQGPAADSRWKPNACAPGDYITSLQANTWNGYTSLSGTSMATPHVTGVAAQLCDNYWWLRYEPARIASILMASAVTRGSAPIYTYYTPGLNQYGAGRVDAWLANFGSGQTGWTNWGFDLGAGQGTEAEFYVGAGTTRVVVCMTWHEWASSAGASTAIINDWDLYIDQAPYAGGFNSGEFTAGLSSYDNTEIRYIEFPAEGYYKWKLHPYNATTTGHFSVTVFGVSGPTYPAVDLSLSQGAYYAQPGTPVTMSASVYNPGYLASATWLNTSGGSYLNASYAYLNDGGFADLSNNVTGGSAVTLGDILSYNSRNAYFAPVWWYEGVNPFTVTAYLDNGYSDVETAYVVVDGTPPSAPGSVYSTTHTAGVWSCNGTVTTAWPAASDNLSGVLGYSVSWDTSPSTDPDIYLDTYAQSWIEYVGTTGGSYFHVRAIDQCGNAGPSVHIGPFMVHESGTATYCVAKINSQFCTPAMSFSGTPSVSGADDFHLTATNVLNNKLGHVFWGFTPAAIPFQGGTKCIAAPTRRTLNQSSGGTPSGTDCSGVYDYHWTQAYAAANGITAGTWVYAQYWSRDPQASFTTGLTDAVQFLVCE